MADNDVGGIGVKFTAEAAQLQQELQKLEQRLKQFDSAHGQKKVRLQAELVMPGNRALADFRRDLEKGFGSQGAAGRVKARIELIPPTASEIKALTGKIGDVKVKVVGNFEWGKAPPKTITVKVVEEGSGRPAAGGRTVTQTQAVAQAASGGRTTRAPAPKKTTVAPGGPRVGNAELFADYKDNGALLSDYLDSYRKGGSRVWMGKARDELIRRGMTRDQIVAIEQGAKRPTGGSRGFVSQFMGSPIPSTAAGGLRPAGGAQIKAMQRAGQVPLPYADAGLYNPSAPPVKLTRAPGQRALQLPPEEWLEKRLDEILKLTPQKRMQSGGQWWRQAGQLIGGMSHGTGMSAPQAAGVAAQMTTRLSWPETLKAFDTFSSRIREGVVGQEALFRGMQVMGREQRQIMAIMSSSGTEAAVEGIMRGPKGDRAPKISEMFGGFLGRPNAFPFDAHMQRLMLGGEIPTRLIPQARDWAVGSMQRRGLQPAGAMAGIWETAGGGDVFGADPHGQLRAGGPRGMADPYADWRLRDQRALMRDASQTKGLAGDARESAIRDRNIRAEQKRFEDMTPEDIARRNAEIGSILGRTGGSRQFTGSPFGAPYSRAGSGAAVGAEEFYQPGQERAGVANRTLGIAEDMLAQLRAGATGGAYTAGGERVVTPAQIKRTGRFVTPVGQTSVLPAGVDPRQAARILEAQRAHPENAAVLAAGGVQGFWQNPETGETEVDVNKTFGSRREAQAELARNPSQIAAFDLLQGKEVLRRKTQPKFVDTGKFAGNRDLAAAMDTPLAAPATAGRGLDIPTFIRQRAALPVAAEAPAPPIGSTLQEQQEQLETLRAGGGGGGGRPPPTAAGAGAGDDEVGQPRPGGRVAELLNTIEQGKFAVQGARQAGQVRAVGTTVASQLGGLLGRGVDVVKVNEMTTILGKMAKVVEVNRAGFDALDKAVEEFGEGAKELEPFEKALQGPNRELATLNKQFQALQPNKFAQMATGLTSSIGGTIIGLGLFNAVSAAITGVGNALEEPTDRLMGFRRTGERTGVTLGALNRQFNGLADIAVTTATAQSGLGDSVAGQIRPLLAQRAAIEGGNSAFKEQLDLIRSAGFFERNPGAGITQTTGGLLGTPIGGTQPFLEQFLQSGSPIGGPTSGPQARGAIGGAAIGAGSGALIGATAGLIGGPLAPLTVTAGGLGGALIGGAIGGIGGLLGGTAAELANQGGPTFAARARGEAGGLSEEETQRLDEFRQALASVNDGLEKANPRLAETAHFVELLGNTSPAAEAAVAATQKFLSEMPGITDDQLKAAEALRFAIIDPRTGKAPVGQTSKEFQKTITDAVRGLALPGREQAAAARALPIQAQLQLSRAQGQFQRENLIPGQSFLRQLAAGRAPGGAQGGVQISNPLRAGTVGLPPDVLRGGLLGGQNIDTSQLTEGLSQVETLGNKGRDALVGMIKAADGINRSAGIPSNLLQQFNSLTEAAGKTAATIRSINQASAWAQVNLQVKQINEQIYIMSRSLEDARSFLSGAGGGELGLLQNRARSLDIAQAELGFRQQSLSLANQELGITASTLQLQQRQRQINFQRAIAGFVTPGQTPEEIAARQEEARLEADFAQRQQDIGVTQLDNQRESVSLAREQLGISKEQFAVQQAMIQVSAERAVGDLARGIALLQEQARVTVQLQVNSEAVEAYQAVLEEQMAAIESVITEASNTHQTILTESAALIASYSGTIATWQSMLISQLSNYVNGATAAFSTLGNSSYSSPSQGTGGGGGGGGAGTNATGFYGSVSSKTRMTVGEAGPETIAILRNPRSMTWGGGGGGEAGPTIIVNVSGNNVGSQQDADELAATIARKVEETMSRRSSLLGMRTN